MRLSDFEWVRSMNSPIMLCLCLVLVGIMISGAAGCDQQGVLLPGIGYFKASPQKLEYGQATNYMIKVNNAEEILLYEAGVLIANWNGPPSGTHTHKITFTGMPSNAIPTEDGNFKALLVISNEKGKLEKELMLSVASPSPPAAAKPEAPDNETGDNKSYWLGERFLPIPPHESPTSAIPATEYPPQFADCPPGCNYCLKPDEAAELGLKQKCSDELCYYSPDQEEKFYCYKEPEGWCCVGGHGGQVIQATKTECEKDGGDWYADQSLAMQACEETCWCCRHQDGAVGNVTVDECLRVGSCYATQYQAMQACQEMMCWCCADGNVVHTTEIQCLQMGGCCHDTQAEANEACSGPIGDRPGSPGF
jgi:hypothetical protein